MSTIPGSSHLHRAAQSGPFRLATMIRKRRGSDGLQFFSCRLIGALIIVFCVGVPAWVHGQPAGCTLVADEHNPTEKILRCGDNLVIRNAPNTSYHATSPNEVRLDSGALLIEFAPKDRKRRFQVLAPHTVASVRGTKWAVEATAERTSTLVITGVVEVRRPKQKRGTLLKAGEGSDVSAGSGRIVAKRWAKKRVDALLARFGQ